MPDHRSNAGLALKEAMGGEIELRDLQEKFGCREEFGSDVGMNAPVRARVARLLIKKLSEECDRYCILTGYEELPDRFDSDIDFMVSPRDLERIPAMIDEIAEATSTYLFQAISHEVSARAFRLAAKTDEGIAFIQPDSCSDYRHFGKLWLRADEMLAARRQHPRGFWIPGAAYEFVYYLIKRLNKRDFTYAHGSRLSGLYGEDATKCDELLRRFWRVESANALMGMAASGNWQPLMQDVERYRRELMEYSAERFPANLARLGKRASHTMERLLQPTGGSIAFIGPDGCGKSSVIEGVTAEFAPAFQKIVRFHLRPKSLPARRDSDVPVTDPHGKPVGGRLFSIAKLLYLFADYWLGYVTEVRTATARTRLVIFDRYFDDIVVDPKRILYGGPKWLPKFLARLAPRPEVVFLLNASPEILWSRKQEVRYEEVVRQQAEYLRDAREMGDVIVIDAAGTRKEVVLEVREAILDYFAERTRRRLKLTKTRSDKKDAPGRTE
jgi:thymidylate kinase